MKRTTISIPFLPLLLAIALPGVVHAQATWPMPSATQRGSVPAMPWFPFAAQPQRSTPAPTAPAMPFPWMGPGTQQNSSQPWGAPAPGYAPAMPSMGMFPFGSQAASGSGAMGMMMAPMMGFMAPMMTNYAIASMNPTTMTNFFGMMTNPGGGMMPFGGMGFTPNAYGPGTAYPATGSGYAWSPAPAMPWMQTPAVGSQRSPGASSPAMPPFFPFFSQGTQRR